MPQLHRQSYAEEWNSTSSVQQQRLSRQELPHPQSTFLSITSSPVLATHANA